MTTNDFLRMLKVAADTTSASAQSMFDDDRFYSGLNNMTENSQEWKDYTSQLDKFVANGGTISANARNLQNVKSSIDKERDYWKNKAREELTNESIRGYTGIADRMINGSWFGGTAHKFIKPEYIDNAVNDFNARYKAAASPYEKLKLRAEFEERISPLLREQAAHKASAAAAWLPALKAYEVSLGWAADPLMALTTGGHWRGLGDAILGKDEYGRPMTSDAVARIVNRESRKAIADGTSMMTQSALDSTINDSLNKLNLAGGFLGGAASLAMSRALRGKPTLKAVVTDPGGTTTFPIQGYSVMDRLRQLSQLGGTGWKRFLLRNGSKAAYRTLNIAKYALPAKNFFGIINDVSNQNGINPQQAPEPGQEFSPSAYKYYAQQVGGFVENSADRMMKVAPFTPFIPGGTKLYGIPSLVGYNIIDGMVNNPNPVSDLIFQGADHMGLPAWTYRGYLSGRGQEEYNTTNTDIAMNPQVAEQWRTAINNGRQAWYDAYTKDMTPEQKAELPGPELIPEGADPSVIQQARNDMWYASRMQNIVSNTYRNLDRNVNWESLTPEQVQAKLKNYTQEQVDEARFKAANFEIMQGGYWSPDFWNEYADMDRKYTDQMFQNWLLARDRSISGFWGGNTVMQGIRGLWGSPMSRVYESDPNAARFIRAYVADSTRRGLEGDRGAGGFYAGQFTKALMKGRTPEEIEEMFKPAIWGARSAEGLGEMMNGEGLPPEVSQQVAGMIAERSIKDLKFGVEAYKSISESVKSGKGLPANLSGYMGNWLGEQLKNMDPKDIAKQMDLEHLDALSRIVGAMSDDTKSPLPGISDEEWAKFSPKLLSELQSRAVSLAMEDPLKGLPLLASMFGRLQGWDEGLLDAMKNPWIFWSTALLLLGGGLLLGRSLFSDESENDKAEGTAAAMRKELDRQRELLGENTGRLII